MNGKLMLILVALAACRRSDRTTPGDRTLPADVAEVSVTRPTVIAYFVIPAGAVDTSRDLATEADDWNVGMAALRDSLESSGIALAMVTVPNARIHVSGKSDTTLALGAPGTAGYVFVRPDGARCVRPGGADADSVKVAARRFASAAGGSCT